MKIHLLSLFLFLFTIAAFGQDDIKSNRVVISKEYLGSDVSPEEGKRRALDLARAEAIKQTVGVLVSEELFRNQTELTKESECEEYFDTFSRLSRSTAYGKIIKEQVTYSTKIDDQGIPIYSATIDACVVEDKPNSDPTFTATLNMDKPVFFDRGNPEKNDALEFSIQASQKCYIYLFNLLASDSVQLLIPNTYVKDALYDPSSNKQSFEKELEAIGAEFIVGLPPGKSRTKEALYLVALKDNVSFPVQQGKTFSTGILSAMQDIMQWLVRIPPDRRTETFKSYEIRRKE